MTRRVKNGYAHEMNGWLYVSIHGSPYERGYAYGELVSTEMKEIDELVKKIIN